MENSTKRRRNRPPFRMNGPAIRARRIEKGLTVEQVAEHLEVSVEVVRGIERSRRSPDLVEGALLAELLDMPLPSLTVEIRRRRAA